MASVYKLGGKQCHVYHEMGGVDVGGHWRRADKVTVYHGCQDGTWYTAESVPATARTRCGVASGIVGPRCTSSQWSATRDGRDDVAAIVGGTKLRHVRRCCWTTERKRGMVMWSVHGCAYSEWALYEMDVVTWLLMSVGDEECGSWAIADMSFALLTRGCSLGAGGRRNEQGKCRW